jgi:signal transduction histidine kinase
MASSNLLRAQDTAGRPSRRGSAAHMHASHHAQFYEGDEYLVRAVSEYIATGLSAGQRVIIIASEQHRSALLRELARRGLDPASARATGRLQLLDAQEALAQIMSGDMPDAKRFARTMGPLVERKGPASKRTRIRAYGEMVDLLAKRGNSNGSILLESLWNELASIHDFELLCGYAMTNFANASDASNFHEICRQHVRVAPTERYTQADSSERLLEISLLQQRAQALENEVARREKLELQLREALERQEQALVAERAARTEAESANRAKNQFLAVMSHELRTPLNAIAGHAQLIELGLHGPVTNAQHEALDRIDRSQRHLLSLVNDVLDLARVDSGRAEYLLEPVDVHPLVDAIVAMIEPLLTAGQLTCRVAGAMPGAAPLTVLADREKVQQILLNLLTNAIKCTSAGGRITIDATYADASGMACIEVRDTGIGIPAEKIETVFEPFVQLATRLSARPDGIGLGLTISRRFARAMQGDLAVTSVNGEGACFRLTLPVAPPPV